MVFFGVFLLLLLLWMGLGIFLFFSPVLFIYFEFCLKPDILCKTVEMEVVGCMLENGHIFSLLGLE